MNIIKIQLLLILFGTALYIILSGDYIAYILGSFTVIIPTILFVFLWKKNNFFAKNNSLPYLILIHLIKVFFILIFLFLLMKQKNLHALTVFMGFFVSCQAYLLAGLVLQKR